MMSVCGFASRCLMVTIAIAACSSTTQQGLTGDDDGGNGNDAGIDAGTDAAVDGGGLPIDGGVMPDAPPPPPPEPGELETMCGSVPSTPAAWEACRHKRFCETHVHCSTSNLFASVQECIDLDNAKLGGQDTFDQVDAFEAARSVTAGRASINVAEFTQCLREFSPQRCTTAKTAPSCALRYSGTVVDHGGCFSDAECISPGASCAPRDCGASCCMGTCTPLAKLGQHCDDYGTCEPGLVCSFVSLTCVTGDVDSACNVIDCDAGNWCDMRSKTCKADLAEGGICLGTDHGLTQCGGETVCAGDARRTTPRCLRATSVGDKCGDLCRGNLICDVSAPDPQGLGVCRSVPVLNQPCSDSTGCIGANVYCAAGTCLPKPGPGDMCPAPGHVCRPGLFCTDQLGDSTPICRVPFADGESGCKQDAHCQSHFCTGNDTMAGECLPTQSTCL
jgi:hypothetical protein